MRKFSFTSPYSIDQCIRELHKLGDLRLMVDRVDRDSCTFDVGYRQWVLDCTTVFVGSLARVEPNETQIDGTARLPYKQLFVNVLLVLLIALVLACSCRTTQKAIKMGTITFSFLTLALIIYMQVMEQMLMQRLKDTLAIPFDTP